MVEFDNTNLVQLQDRQQKLDSKITEIGKYVFQFNSKQKAFNKEVKFYEDNEDCPTCEQTIETGFRLDKVQNAKNKWQELEQARKDAEAKVGELEDEKQILQQSIDAENNKVNEINTVKEKITWTQRRLNTLQSDLSELDSGVHSLSEASDLLSNEESKKDDLTNLRLELAEQRDYNNVITELLKDTGIKTKIITQY